MPHLDALGPEWADRRQGPLGGAFTTYNGVSRPGVAQVFASMGCNPAVNYLLLMQN